MENTLLSDSSISKSFSGCSELSSDTESSWTPYIVDFVIHNNNNTTNHLEKKKKRKKTNQADDDALQDTASSPTNKSPKVFCIERQEGSYRTKRDHPLNFNNILEEKNKASVQRRVLGNDDMRRETTESTSTALKKKGLRLVPVSMLVKSCQLAG